MSSIKRSKTETMKTVELKTGEQAITVNVKHYIRRQVMIDLITDVVHNKDLDENKLTKSKVMEHLRDHLFYQGRTTYCDWYEDTDQTPIINEIHKRVVKVIDNLFPELT